jgi:hypothetical protein
MCSGRNQSGFGGVLVSELRKLLWNELARPSAVTEAVEKTALVLPQFVKFLG